MKWGGPCTQWGALHVLAFLLGGARPAPTAPTAELWKVPPGTCVVKHYKATALVSSDNNSRAFRQYIKAHLSLQGGAEQYHSHAELECPHRASPLPGAMG